jgi:hypothetical protein
MKINQVWLTLQKENGVDCHDSEMSPGLVRFYRGRKTKILDFSFAIFFPLPFIS